MADVLTHTRRSTVEQLSGVAAQVLLGAPALFASLVLARWSDLKHVAELAVTFGTTSTVFVASSFNLTQHLALWGTKDFSLETFWMTRAIASTVAALLAIGILSAYGATFQLVLLAALIKIVDGVADLRFGQNLLLGDTGTAMRRLLGWSAARMAVLMSGAFAAREIGLSGLDALLVGGALQVLTFLPWRRIQPPRHPRAVLAESGRLARSAAHLSLAATACGLLVTTPRLIAKYVVAPAELGYIGVVFVCSTLIGMFFNVAWYRLASARRTSSAGRALRIFLLEGVAYGGVLVLGLVVGAPIVARVYAITDHGFSKVFVRYGSIFVVFYFVMSLANLLKTSRIKLLETMAYSTAALGLAVVSFVTRQLQVGMLAASAVLFAFIVFGLRTDDPVKAQ